MAKTKEYQHFCPVARSLEVIGEKWSLLIVRDLLRGPQRFTDLLRYLGGITPKWLTLRLRDLEAASIIEADRETGRREVWYRLTPRGRELAPVIESLAVWGIDHARRPPLPGEPVNPEQSLAAVAVYRNRRNVRLVRPATWELCFGAGRTSFLRFDGERWSLKRAGADIDVRVETAPETWAAFLMADAEDRAPFLPSMRITGDPDRVEEFLRSFGVEAPVGVE